MDYQDLHGRIFSSIFSDRYEMLETVGLCFASFMIPFMLGHPQLLVGVLVNATLFLSALRLHNKGAYAVMIMPSLGLLSRGIVFGPMTGYLVYMLPAIWIGNLLLVRVYQMLSRNKIVGVIASSAAKSVLLFVVALALVRVGLAPVLFLSVMGLFQLGTALGGGMLALGLSAGHDRLIAARE